MQHYVLIGCHKSFVINRNTVPISNTDHNAPPYHITQITHNQTVVLGGGERICGQ